MFSSLKKTKKLLSRYLLQVNPDNSLLIEFQNRKQLDRNYIYLFLNRLKSKLRIDKSISLTPHKWRHTLATELLKNKVDLETVRMLLGHSDLSTTQKYLHLSKDDIKQAVMKKSPIKLLLEE